MTKNEKNQRIPKIKSSTKKTLSLKSCYERMIELLDVLVENAKHLKEAAFQPIAEEQLLHIQDVQEALMQELLALEEIASKENLEATDEQAKTIQERLQEFQKLNEEYVELLTQKVSVIQFADDQGEER